MQRGQKCVRSLARLGGGGGYAQGVITNGQVFVVDKYWVYERFQFEKSDVSKNLIRFRGKCSNFGGVEMMIYANDLAMASFFT